jgi:ribosomal-protein-alanine N-acetyltransferase
MTMDDIDVVAQLERKIYPQPWSEDAFVDELSRENRAYFVVEEIEEIIGYGGMFLVEEDAHIATVAVTDEYRGRGIGTLLMLALVEVALEAGAENLTLEVRLDNYAARDVYQRFGFAPIGIRKNYYRDSDALVMWVTDIEGDVYQQRLDEIRRSLA